ncbi:MAG: hypothetical protein E7323_07650 [Clostridiales bacterium]|nr:hypothetical protein [Clostridiales bacterium]
MNALLIAFAVVLLILLVSFLVYDLRQTRKHRQLVRKLYASPILDNMQDELHFAKKHAVEYARVDKNGVHFRFLSPGYGEYHFIMQEHGFRQLTPAQQSAMRTILEERLPHFTEQTHYRLSRSSKHLPNGNTEYAYTYTMTNHYKEMLTRAPYYAPQMVPYIGF